MEKNEVYAGKAGEKFEKVVIPPEFDLDTSFDDKEAMDRYRIPLFLKLVDQFAKSIDDGVSYSPNLIDGWRNQQVIEALRKSHQTNSRINVVDYLLCR